MAVFKFRPAATRSAGENLTVSAAKTNRPLATESVTKSNGSTHSDRSLRSHQTPTVASEMSLARELHWVDALLPGVRNLLDVHSKTNNERSN